MTTLKMHYEGWISLPSGLRQQLGLHSGTRLDVQLVNGAIMLRPTKGTRAPPDREAAIEPPAVTAASTPSLETALPQKRPRGRPRKVPTVGRPAEPMPGNGQARSCPAWWCRSGAPWRVGPPCQVAMAGRLTGAVSLTVPRVSRLM